ncbi:MAG: hypothetical protein WBG19_02735 [Thermoplasmata archaeon]
MSRPSTPLTKLTFWVRVKDLDFWATLTIVSAIGLFLVLVFAGFVVYTITSGFTGTGTGSGIELKISDLARPDGGSAGCRAEFGELCYRFQLSVSGSWTPSFLVVSDLYLSVRATEGVSGYGSPVTLPKDASVHFLNSNGVVIANATWINATWTGHSNWPVSPQVTIVLDTGLTSDPLSGDTLWINIADPGETGPAVIELT